MDILSSLKKIADTTYLVPNKSYIFATFSNKKVYITLLLKRRDYLLYKLYDNEVESIDNELMSNLFFIVHLRLPMDCDENALSCGIGIEWFNNIINLTVPLSHFDNIPTQTRIEKMIDFIRKLYHHNDLHPIDLNDVMQRYSVYPELFTMIGLDELSYD